MSVSRPLFSVIGFMIMLSASLAYFISMKWLLLGLVISVSLIQVPFTRFCPLDIIIKKIPWVKENMKCDLEATDEK